MEKVKLGEICVFIRNGVNIKNDKNKSGIPITRIETIANGIISENNLGYADIFDEKYENYYLKQNDILMSHINSMKHLGKVAICNEDKKIIHGMNLLNIRLKENIFSKYVYYFFRANSFKKQLNKISKQSVNQSSFNVKELRKISIYLPDLQIQEKIANRLDKVQEIIDIRKKQIEELEELIKAQFVEMFGTVYDNKNQYKIETLKNVFELIKDGTHSTPSYTNDNINGIKFLSAKDVTTGKINWSNIKYIPIELHNELSKRIKPQKDDILLAKNGTTGTCAKVENDEVFDIYVSLALLRPKKEYSVDYLVQAINNDMTKEQFDRSLKGVGVPNLHLGEIEKAKIIVPPIKLQNQFADIVKQIDKQKLELQKSLEELQKLQESLMNRYFGG